jgi:hypothetical protein
MGGHAIRVYRPKIDTLAWTRRQLVSAQPVGRYRRSLAHIRRIAEATNGIFDGLSNEFRISFKTESVGVEEEHDDLDEWISTLGPSTLRTIRSLSLYSAAYTEDHEQRLVVMIGWSNKLFAVSPRVFGNDRIAVDGAMAQLSEAVDTNRARTSA